MNRRSRTGLAVIILLGLLAVVQQWLADRRPSRWLESKRRFVVSNSLDAGPGSLREAIFDADAAGERARIDILAARIVLRSPLPPLVNPFGIVVDGGVIQPEIDASGIGSGSVFDVASATSEIAGITVTNA